MCFSIRCATRRSQSSPRKNSVWRSAGVARRMRSTCGQKAHVEHAVGFVENHDLARRRAKPACASRKSTQPAGCRNDNLRAAANRLQLRVFTHAADDWHGANAGAFRYCGKGFVNLDGEFARRRQNQSLRLGDERSPSERFDDGKRERQSFSGAGLGGGNHIEARKSGRNGLRLNGGRSRKVRGREVAAQDR